MRTRLAVVLLAACLSPAFAAPASAAEAVEVEASAFFPVVVAGGFGEVSCTVHNRTDGDLRLQGLRAGAWAVGQGQARWQLDTEGRDAMQLRLDLTDKPEFDGWRWVDFWYPMQHVVTFKRGVYARALDHLAPFARAVAGVVAVPPPAEGLLPQPQAGLRRFGRRG